MKDEYIPDTITVGQASGGFTAFITCKWHHEKWMNPSVFERICGYKPHLQRDSVKQLKKIITNSVVSIDNVPTAGFKLVNSNQDIYNLNRKYSDRGDVVLQDPRGFNIGITETEFWKLFASVGYNMENGILTGSFAYIWKDEYSRFSLINTASASYKSIVKASKNVAKKTDDTTYLTASQLEVGKVYKTVDNHDVVYLGKHDTYSSTCHLDAYDNRKYSIDSFCEDRTDLTGTDKHVFFVLGVKIDKYGEYEIPAPNGKYGSNCNPYIAKKSVSKYILKKLPDRTMSGYKMYNTNVTVTYEKIVDDMNHSLFFNKLDFNKCELAEETLDLEHFISEYGYDNRYACASFPFKTWDRASYIYTRKFGCTHIDAYEVSAGRHDYTIENKNSAFNFGYYSRNNDFKYKNITPEELYDNVRPYVKTFYLENGNKVDQFAARCFMPKDKRNRW